MDPLTLAIEAVFGLVFVVALVDWWRRRDAVSRDVVIVFGSLIVLFVVSLATMALGPVPPIVRAIAIAALLGQPVAVLRLAADLRPVPRPVLVGAAIGWVLTTIPFAVLGSATPRPLALAAVGVFVVVEATAAAYMAGAARRRAGATAIRLWIAAAATLLFALAILAAGAGSSIEGAGETVEAVGRFLALAAALGYLAAFAPPAFLRRMLQADTAYVGLGALVSAGDADAVGVWRRFLGIATGATGALGGYIVAGDPGDPGNPADPGDGRLIVAELGLDAALVGRRVTGVGGAVDAGEREIGALDDLEGLALASGAARARGARIAQGIRLGTGEAAPVAVLVSTHRSLFGAQDRQLLAALGRQAAGVVEHLETLVARARLADQLAATVEALQSASQAKSDFLASMSHELRTPLNAIIGFSDLMRREPSDDAGNVVVPLEWVEHIRQGGTHLVELVNDVLDLSRVEAGRLELDREPVEVQPAVAESVAGLRPLADRKGLSIEVDVEAGEQVDADRGRLRQVLYNLLSNAIKFTPDGGRITVEGRTRGEAYHLSVIDTGVGISPEDQAIVFDEFRQVGGGRQRTEGSGLGLALSRRLVAAHGGRIELESTPGVGSRFTVVLPLAASAAEVPASAPAREGHVETPEAAATAMATRAAPVLVVEDDPSAVRLLKAYLEPEGYRVRVAADGEQALVEVRAERPAAILLDVLLPGIDGWDVLRRLKADPGLRDIPVVIVTVVDEKDVGLALGAVDYLVKPIDRDALLASLERLALTTTVRSRRVRILAVDDEPAALEMLSQTLRPAGFEIVSARGGMAGIAMARAERPDLVICDLVMPDLDGFGVVAALKADPSTAAIPIIILTGYDLSASDKRRLNGKVLRIVSKGAEAEAGLRAWLIRADPLGRSA